MDDGLSDEDYRWYRREMMDGRQEHPNQYDRRKRINAFIAARYPDSQRRERAAYHEAGHAVAACALGRRVDYCSIRQGAEATARDPFDITGAPAADLLGELEGHVTVKMAGTAAEELRWTWTTSPEPGVGREIAFAMHRLLSSARDLPQDQKDAIAEFAAGRPIADACIAFIERCEPRARAILAANWPAVERLANGLLVHEFLDAAQIAEVLRDVRLPNAPGSGP